MKSFIFINLFYRHQTPLATPQLHTTTEYEPWRIAQLPFNRRQKCIYSACRHLHKTIPTAHCFPKNALHLVNIVFCWFEYIAQRSMILLLKLCVHTMLAKWFIETDGKKVLRAVVCLLLGCCWSPNRFSPFYIWWSKSKNI